MKIIISPAKIMKEETIGVEHLTTPIFLSKALHIWDYLKTLDHDSLIKAWDCNEDLIITNKKRLAKNDLKSNLMPALLTYDGLQYKKMAPNVFDDEMWAYVNEHLCILSGLYGVLRPLDGINSYRLMMGANLAIDGFKNLYSFWGDLIYQEVVKNDNIILNLASKEYSDVITPYVKDDVKIYDVIFLCNSKGKLVTKATEAKACRGLMVQFLARNKINDIKGVTAFNEMGYSFNTDLSVDNKLVFVKQ